MKRKIYYQKHETKTTNIKGYIEIEFEYIQIYKNFAAISSKINSATSFKLLHWILAERLMDDNGLNSIKMFEDFNNFLTSSCGNDCSIEKSTFYKCLTELINTGALTKVDRGHYFANPNLFWGEDIQKRIEHLKLADLDPEIQLLNPGE